MPIYEYQCSQCGHNLESLEKMTDAPLTQCPVCGKPTLQRLVSAAGFQLKGTGWYATDFRNKGKPSETPLKKESGSGTSDNKSTDTKSSSDTQTKDTAVTST